MDRAKPLLSLQIALQDDDGTDFIDEPFILLPTLLAYPRFTYSTLR